MPRYFTEYTVGNRFLPQEVYNLECDTGKQEELMGRRQGSWERIDIQFSKPKVSRKRWLLRWDLKEERAGMAHVFWEENQDVGESQEEKAQSLSTHWISDIWDLPQH